MFWPGELQGGHKESDTRATFIFTFLFLSPWAALAQAEFSPVSEPLLTRRKTFWLPFPFSWFTFHNLALLFTDTAGWEKFSWLHLISQGLQQSPCRDGKELLIHFWEVPRPSLPAAPPPQSRGEVDGQQPLSLFLAHWPGARVRFWCKPPSPGVA